MSKLNFDEVLNLKVGDTLYEYGYGVEICSTVVEPPFVSNDDDNYVKVKAKDNSTGDEFHYGVHRNYQTYAPNVYNYKAYTLPYE